MYGTMNIENEQCHEEYLTQPRVQWIEIVIQCRQALQI